MWHIVHYVIKIFNKQTDHLFPGAYLWERIVFKIFITSCKPHHLVEKAGIEQTSRVFFSEPICHLFGVDVLTVKHSVSAFD